MGHLILGLIHILVPCLGQSAGYVQLYGTITNVVNQEAIKNVQVFLKTNTHQTITEITFMNGTYDINLPCEAVTMIVAAAGYRTISMPVSPKREGLYNARFFVPILLTPIVQQAIDIPYFQQEQKHVEISASVPLQSQKFATRLFKVIDAITEQSIESSICLFYTQNSDKKCSQIQPQQSGFEVRFDEPDIIAIEVSAKGYQQYKGNLILEYLDNQQRTYVIRLVRDLTVFALTSTDTNETYWLMAAPTSKRIMLHRHTANQYYQFVSEGHYQLATLAANDSGFEILRNIEISRGFNGQVISRSSVSKTFHTLYFNQSDYILLPTVQSQLDTLARWLVTKPSQKILVVGHTDNIGNAQLNQILSEFRAKVVFNYLIEKGVMSSQMNWKGMGSQVAAAPNDTEINREKNRRVEILFLTNPKP